MESPSKAPEAVMDTVEIRKPQQIIRRALLPTEIVEALSVNIPIRYGDAVKQIIIPRSIMTPFIQRVR